jgi:ATP-dependent RNA helicase DeaD
MLRDVVAHYVNEHNVPEIDVAAAIAVAMQGDEPLLLEAAPEPPAYERRDRGDRADRADRGRGDRGDRPARESGRSRHTGQPLATYRIAVGKRHRVEPRQIVGAIANEGGLRRADFGNITIRPDFSLVELPADLASETWDALRSTRISGKLIDLQLDHGAPGSRAPRGRPSRAGRDETPQPASDGDRPRTKKPRRKD